MSKAEQIPAWMWILGLRSAVALRSAFREQQCVTEGALLSSSSFTPGALCSATTVMERWPKRFPLCFQVLCVRFCVFYCSMCLAGWPLFSEGARLRCGSELLSDLLFVCGDRGIYLGEPSTRFFVCVCVLQLSHSQACKFIVWGGSLKKLVNSMQNRRLGCFIWLFSSED